MRKNMWFCVVLALLVVPAGVSAQQQVQQSQQSSAPQSQASSTQTAQTPPVQEDSLAAAARRAREQKKDQPKSAKIITNDNIPNQGGISTVGANPSSTDRATADNAAGTPNGGNSAASGNDEKTWRERFAKLRHKLEQDQQELSVMERELGVLNVQYYNDPVKAMQQEFTRSDITKKTADIEAKKQQVEADKQAISDAEDDLRKAGGDSGWAR